MNQGKTEQVESDGAAGCADFRVFMDRFRSRASHVWRLLESLEAQGSCLNGDMTVAAGLGLPNRHRA